MLAPDDPAVLNRRARLREWIDLHFKGSLTLFIASTNDGEKQVNHGELSALLRTKTFGERRARSLEAMAHMPPRYLEGSSQAEEAAWPFTKVSLTRMLELKNQLSAHRGPGSFREFEGALDLLVSQWEQHANPPEDDISSFGRK